MSGLDSSIDTEFTEKIVECQKIFDSLKIFNDIRELCFGYVLENINQFPLDKIVMLTDLTKPCMELYFKYCEQFLIYKQQQVIDETYIEKLKLLNQLFVKATVDIKQIIGEYYDLAETKIIGTHSK